MDAIGIAPLLQVCEMPVAIHFYRDVLGFEIIAQSQPGDHFHWALLTLHGAELMLNTAYDDGQRPQVPDPARVRTKLRDRAEVKGMFVAHDEHCGEVPAHSFQIKSSRRFSERERRNKMDGMNTPPIVSQQEWETARQQLLAKEKALTRSRDALAADRRRMPWMAVGKAYEFEGPQGKVSLLDLFEGRRQLILYRAFFEPGVFGWPEHACRGCSLGADQIGHLAHLNARDTTLAYASRAPQKDIERLKARMGWQMPWYTITDSFDADFGVDEWHGHNVFFRDGDQVFRTYFINNRGDEAMGTIWSYLDITPLGRQEAWEDSPEGYPQTQPYKWWNWHDNYDAQAAPDQKWVDIITDPQEAARRRAAEEKG